MTLDLFDALQEHTPATELIAPGAVVLRRFAATDGRTLLTAMQAVLMQAPLRHLITPGGFRMSVAMSNCGALGWISDRTGYRYAPHDPDSGQPWPAMPDAFLQLAVSAAENAGFADFRPDACLINRYAEGTRLSLHQDKNERDFSAPIVSVSLGLPAVFLFGGMERHEKSQRLLLQHGDVVVWGGPSRLRYHGILPLKPGRHELTDEYRFNLTFRQAG